MNIFNSHEKEIDIRPYKRGYISLLSIKDLKKVSQHNYLHES